MDADLNEGVSPYSRKYEDPSALDLIDHMEQWAQQPAPAADRFSPTQPFCDHEDECDCAKAPAADMEADRG
jgi:hypothetical protein